MDKIKCLECNASLSTLGKNHFKICVGRARNNKEYLALHPGAETMSKSARANKAVSLKKYISKFGNEIGEQKYKEYCKKLSDKNSFEFFKTKKGWSFEQFEKYNKSRGITLDNLILKYGEEQGTEKFNEYCLKQKHSGNTLEYFVQMYGEEKGKAKYKEVCAKKGITRDNMIRVHGEKAGIEKHTAWLKARNHSSHMANDFIREIIKKLPNDFKFHAQEFGGEFCIYKDRPFLYDLVITYPTQKCIEFNGDFWHANPLIYEADDSINLRGTKKKKASEIWDADIKKLNIIRERGYNVLVVWESDFVNRRESIIEETVKWILLSNV